MPKDIDVCGNFRPYAQGYKTLTLGCINCGRTAFVHDDTCEECSGTGRGSDKNGFVTDTVICTICQGTGRKSGKVEYL